MSAYERDVLKLGLQFENGAGERQCANCANVNLRQFLFIMHTFRAEREIRHEDYPMHISASARAGSILSLEASSSKLCVPKRCQLVRFSTKDCILIFLLEQAHESRKPLLIPSINLRDRPAPRANQNFQRSTVRASVSIKILCPVPPDPHFALGS